MFAENCIHAVKQSAPITFFITNLNVEKVRGFFIPLPPLAEQERIVAKLENLMKFCDELEANIRHARANADQLLQTALKEALEPKDNQSCENYAA